MEAFTKIITLAPNESPAYQGRGQCRANLKQYAGAIKDYSRAIELNPKSATLYNQRGVAKKESGDSKGAMADYSRAIELDPKWLEDVLAIVSLRDEVEKVKKNQKAMKIVVNCRV